MMDASLNELISFLHSNQRVMVEQLHQFCQINSGSENLMGLNTMHDELNNAYKPFADTIESISFPAVPIITMQGEIATQTVGNALLIRKRPKLAKRVLLVGHMDTVYSPTHPFQTLTYLSENRLNGPGVADMKGGLIVMLHALAAFEQHPAAKNLGVDVFINADEELGSPASATWLTKITNPYQAGLVYEPAMSEQGTLAKNRRGSGKLTLIAHGKAAHAGRAFTEGRNAIYHLAKAIQRIHELNNQQSKVTINIGKIAGGTALNIVPDKAVAKLDVRISEPADELWVTQQVNSIIASINEPGFDITLHSHFARPVKRINAATEQLFARIRNLGKQLNLSLDWQDSGGCCDGNNLAVSGLPVIDTLGVRGGSIHSADEYVLLDSLVERAALTALLLIDIAQEGVIKP